MALSLLTHLPLPDRNHLNTRFRQDHTVLTRGG
jgi:hypothetical protein